MRLALRELFRRPGRFLTAGAILSLLATLVMLFGGILDGLLDNSTAGVRAQRGDALVFSAQAKESFLRSRIDRSLRARIEAVPGVARTGGIGIVQLGARLPDAGPRDLVDTVLFGYEVAPQGLPDTPPADGEVIADDTLRDQGVERGMVLRLGPARSPVTVIGFVEQTNYLGQGALWGSPTTWRTVLTANRPDEILPADTFQSLVVVGEPSGPGGLAAAIDAATAGATRTLTVEAAADALPGVKEQRATFGQIINTIVFVALVVVGLFFALLTVERMGLYGVLKAIGASSRTLFAGLVVQAAVVTISACVIAGALAVLVDVTVPAGSLPFAISAGRFATSTVTLLVAAIAGCAFSLRRVLRVDPASAIGGSL